MSAAAPVRAEDLSNTRRWLMFAALMGVYVFYAFCWNTENFLRPYMAESLGLSKEQVAAFYSLQALGALIGALIIPQFADRYSRRNTFALIAVAFGGPRSISGARCGVVRPIRQLPTRPVRESRPRIIHRPSPLA